MSFGLLSKFKQMTRTIKSILALSIAASFFIYCEKDEEMPNIQFFADKTNIKVGETITFSASSGAAGYALFPGDAGHEWEKSAAMLVPGEGKDSVYRIPDPFVKRFEMDASGAEEVPDSLIEGRNKLSKLGVEDGGVKFNIATPGWGNDLIIKPNVGVGEEATILTLRMKFANPDPDLQIRFTTTLKINGVYTVADWPDGRIYPTFAAVGEYTDMAIDLAKTIEAWKSNAGLAYDVLEEVMIVIGGGPAANRYAGDFYVQSATLGIDGYLPFDVGYAMDAFISPVEFDYTYNEAGTYTATLVATGSGVKNYTGDGYQTDRTDVNAGEYDYDRQVITIPIRVED